MSRRAKYDKFILNKIINEDNVSAIVRYGINREDMVSDVDKNTYDFIIKYAEENGGSAPSYVLTADSVDGFEYIPDVSDDFGWLVEKIKGHTAIRRTTEMFETGEFERELNKRDGNDFISNWLPSKLESISSETKVRDKVGFDVKKDSGEFMAEYRRRKAGESYKIWESRYTAIGEYVAGNMYTLFGESGRGKSVFTLEDAIYAAQQGANVLLWTLEMGWYEVMARIYTSISGDARLMSTYYEGKQMASGFNSRQVRTGQLEEDVEIVFEDFLDNINNHVKGNIEVRAIDQSDFVDRSIRSLEADIIETEADFVVIDPFYYMTYEENKNRTTGGGAAETSMKLRALAGRLSIVLIALTQASAKSSDTTEEGGRELKMPEREDVKKASNLMEDAAILIGVDSDYQQGIGIVGILKGRDGGEGDISNVTYLPQFGIVEELAVGDDIMESFDF